MITRDALRNFYRDRAAFLEEIVGMGYKEHPEIFSQFLNTKGMTTGWTDIATVSEYGLFDVKPEGQDAQDDTILEGPTARVQAITFAKQVKVSGEAIEDDLGDGIITNRVPGIMKAALLVCIVLIFLIGIVQGPFMEMTESVAKAIGGS